MYVCMYAKWLPSWNKAIIIIIIIFIFIYLFFFGLNTRLLWRLACRNVFLKWRGGGW